MFAALNSFLTRAVSGYFLNKSLRFRSSASAYLNRTFGTPTNNIKWTWSAWVKRGQVSGYQRIFGVGSDASGVNQGALYFDTSNVLGFFQGDGGGSTEAYLITNALYRDPAAWYHIMFVYDSANGTSSSRILIYINGAQVTSFSTATYPTASLASKINANAVAHAIGVLPTSPSNYFDGEMAEINFVDGQALAPTAFGASSIYNQWLPIRYAGTYGTNGFYLPFSATSATSYAGSFNGSTQYLSVAKNTLFEPTASQAWTVEAWVYLTSLPANPMSVYTYASPAIATGNDLGIYLVLGASTGTVSGGFYSGINAYAVNTSLVAPVKTWTHLAVVSTGSVVTVYVNGISGGTVSSSLAPNASATALAKIGYYEAVDNRYFPGYISNFRFVKGTAVYTANFIPPTAALTAITNTSLLTLQSATVVDNSGNSLAITNNNTVVTSVQSPFLNPTVLTADSSGNANNWTPNNISLTAGSTYDSLTDVPTLTSTTVANYAVMNPIGSAGTYSITNGNLNVKSTGASYALAYPSMQMPASKTYIEFNLKAVQSAYSNQLLSVGIANTPTSVSTTVSNGSLLLAFNSVDLSSYSYQTPSTGQTSVGSAPAANDIAQIAYDGATGKLWFGVNNTWFVSGNPSAGTNPIYTYAPTAALMIFVNIYSTIPEVAMNFGQQPFVYTAPTGFLPLNTFNI